MFDLGFGGFYHGELPPISAFFDQAGPQLLEAEVEHLGEDCPLFKEKPVGRQLEFYQSPAQTRLCLGGNRAGKTSAGARESGWWLTGTHPYRDVPEVGAKGWLVCETREIANEVLLPKLLYYLPTEGPGAVERYDPGTDQRPASIMTKNKSRLVVRTFGQGRRRFQSDAVDFIWGDEEMPHDIYKECLLRLVDLNGCIWLTMTPLMGKTWVYTDIYQPWDSLQFDSSQVSVHQWSIWDNTSLPRRAIATALSGISDELEREAREHGSFTDKTGNIYKQFDPKTHVIDPFNVPAHWHTVLAIDPGYRHPFAASLQAESPAGDRFVIGDYRRSLHDVSNHALGLFRMVDQCMPVRIKDRQLERLLGGHRAGALVLRKIPPVFRNLVIVRDPSAASYGAELLNYGIPTKIANRDLMTGITRVGTMLSNAANGVSPGLYFFRGRASNHIQEMRTYIWKNPDGKDAEPMQVHDDCMDALRYGVMQPLSAKVYPLASRMPSRLKSFTEGHFASVEEAYENVAEELSFSEKGVGELLEFCERRPNRARLTHRGYNEDQIMNHLEQKFGRRFGLGQRGGRGLRHSWGGR